MKITVVSSGPFPPAFSNPYQESLFFSLCSARYISFEEFLFAIQLLPDFMYIYVCLNGKEYILHEVYVEKVLIGGYKCVCWGVTTRELNKNK